MEKYKREVITRESIKAELLSRNTEGIKASVLSIIVISLICVLVLYFSHSLEPIIVRIIVLTLCIVILVIFPALLSIIPLIYGLKYRKAIKNDEFDVLTDKVLYKREEEKSRRTTIYRFLRFENFGDHTVDKSTYEITSNGDEFYIVAYRFKQPVPVLYYPLRSYVYKEK